MNSLLKGKNANPSSSNNFREEKVARKPSWINFYRNSLKVTPQISCQIHACFQAMAFFDSIRFWEKRSTKQSSNLWKDLSSLHRRSLSCETCSCTRWNNLISLLHWNLGFVQWVVGYSDYWWFVLVESAHQMFEESPLISSLAGIGRGKDGRGGHMPLQFWDFFFLS